MGASQMEQIKNKDTERVMIDKKIRILLREVQKESYSSYEVRDTRRYMMRLEQIKQSINKL